VSDVDVCVWLVEVSVEEPLVLDEDVLGGGAAVLVSDVEVEEEVVVELLLDVLVSDVELDDSDVDEVEVVVVFVSDVDVVLDVVVD
jgi:hypothetical protein